MLRTRESNRSCILSKSTGKQIENKELQCPGFGKRRDLGWVWLSSMWRERKIRQQKLFLVQYGLWWDLNCHLCRLVVHVHVLVLAAAGNKSAMRPPLPLPGCGREWKETGRNWWVRIRAV